MTDWRPDHVQMLELCADALRETPLIGAVQTIDDAVKVVRAWRSALQKIAESPQADAKQIAYRALAFPYDPSPGK